MRKRPPPRRCSLCGAIMKARKAGAASPFPYRAGPSLTVLLHGITLPACTGCLGEVASQEIPARAGLHDAVAAALVRKPGRLSGPELRFLREHLRIPSGRFASLLGIDPAHLSRVEAGRTASLGASTDRLARILAAPGACGRRQREMMRELAGAERKGEPSGGRALVFSQERGGGWKRRA